jgi:hypothetical protein
MIWAIGRFPELRHLEPAQRQTVLRRVPWWTYPLIVFRSASAAVVLGVPVGLAVSHVSSFAEGAVGFAVTAATVWTVAYLLQIAKIRMRMRKEIIIALRGQRPPFCYNCGYDLRAAHARCPECGWPVPHADAQWLR